MLKMYCDLCGKPLDSDKSRNFKIKELKASWHESWWQKIDAHDECIKKLFDSVKKNLLKEQEAEWIYGEDETGVDGWHCSYCGFFEPWFYTFDDDINFIKRYEYCPKCGRRMASYTGKQEGR